MCTCRYSWAWPKKERIREEYSQYLHDIVESAFFWPHFTTIVIRKAVQIRAFISHWWAIKMALDRTSRCLPRRRLRLAESPASRRRWTPVLMQEGSEKGICNKHTSGNIFIKSCWHSSLLAARDLLSESFTSIWCAEWNYVKLSESNRGHPTILQDKKNELQSGVFQADDV